MSKRNTPGFARTKDSLSKKPKIVLPLERQTPEQEKRATYVEHLANSCGINYAPYSTHLQFATYLLTQKQVIIIEQIEEMFANFYLWKPNADRIELAAAYLGAMQKTLYGTKKVLTKHGYKENPALEDHVALTCQLLCLSPGTKKEDRVELDNELTEKYVGIQWESMDDFETDMGKVEEIKDKNLSTYNNPLLFYFTTFH
jgi:hypothetical protein